MTVTQAIACLRRQHGVGRSAWLYLSYGRCHISLHAIPEHELHRACSLGLVHVEKKAVRGRGHGSRAVRQVCRWADKHGITLRLYAGPFDDSPFNMKSIIRWYRKFGFKFKYGNEGLRLPR